MKEPWKEDIVKVVQENSLGEQWKVLYIVMAGTAVRQRPPELGGTRNDGIESAVYECSGFFACNMLLSMGGIVLLMGQKEPRARAQSLT